MKRTASALRILAAAVLATLASCGQEALPRPEPAPISDSQLLRCPLDGAPDDAYAVVGPGGGTVKGRRHSLRLPPSAVAQRARYTLRELPTDIIQVEAHPSGPFAHGRRASLTLSYARCPAGVPQDPSKLIIVRKEHNGWAPVEGPIRVDRAARTVTADSLIHLSGYAIGAN
jgi:hypothetical protein